MQVHRFVEDPATWEMSSLLVTKGEGVEKGGPVAQNTFFWDQIFIYFCFIFEEHRIVFSFKSTAQSFAT